MPDAALWFALGFLGVLAYKWAGNALGDYREVKRRLTATAESLDELIERMEGRSKTVREHDHSIKHAHDRLNRLEGAFLAMRSDPESDTASEIRELKKKLIAQDLTILDTAEKVAHRLRDRDRKRVETIEEEIPAADHPLEDEDPALALARARQLYPLPGMPGQMALPLGNGEKPAEISEEVS